VKNEVSVAMDLVPCERTADIIEILTREKEMPKSKGQRSADNALSIASLGHAIVSKYRSEIREDNPKMMTREIYCRQTNPNTLSGKSSEDE